MQAKLLRVIQDGEFFRVGGTTPVKTNVRILSATNRSLEEQMEARQFRSDLYYRLNVFPLRVPPLSERREEIPVLVEYFVHRYNEKFGLSLGMEGDAMRYLQEQQWPGNIRELENVVQRLMITAKGARITLLDVVGEFDDIRGKRSCLLGRTTCSDHTPCIAHHRWRAVAEKQAAFFRDTTVADLLREG